MTGDLDAVIAEAEKAWLCGDVRAGYTCTRPKGHEGEHRWAAAERDEHGRLVIYQWERS